MTTDSVTATVNDVLADSPAETAGIKAGDRILTIDGKQVDGESIRPTIQDSRGAPVTLTVERNGQTVALQPVRPEKSEEFGVIGAVAESIRVTGDVTQEIGRSLGRLVTGDGSDVSSPVGIVQGSSEAVDQGTDTYLWVLGLISLSLALLNLLPLLPLDGGHIAGALFEALRRSWARLRGRPDPGYVDVARMLPVAYCVAGVLLAMGIVLIVGDLVVPVRLPA